MSCFTFNLKNKIVIYGYSVKGRIIADRLRGGSANVIAFFDNKAEEIKCPNEIILTIDKGVKLFADDLGKLTVIISIANVFEHKTIAMQLQNVGFEKIIFFPDFSFEQKAGDVKQMKYVFKRLLDGQIPFGVKLLCFDAFKKHLNTVRLKTVDATTALVPIELIHISDCEMFIENTKQSSGISEELKNLPYYFNTPMAGFNYYLDLYDFFEGKNDNGYDSYFTWKQTMNPMSVFNETDKDRMLNDRFSVYQNMTDALALNNDFFISNPIELKFNYRGYFYLVDGANRTCFYLHKGLRFIPAKLDADSYNAWSSTLGFAMKEKKVLFEGDLFEKYPINIHPILYAPVSSLSFIQYQKYIKICRFLSKNAICLAGKKVLVLNSVNSYFSMFFSRMKSLVTSHVVNEDFKQYNIMINKLCSTETINIITGKPNEIVAKDVFDVIVYLDEDDALWESSEHENNFKRNCSASLVLWGGRYDETPDRLSASFRNYNQVHLCQYCGKNRQLYNLYSFVKRK